VTSQAADMRYPTAEEQMKRLRLRKIYIQLRVPRIKAEIAELAARKKIMEVSGSGAPKKVIDELIYSNQHLVALRMELQSLEQERRTVLQGLKDLRVRESEIGVRASLRALTATPSESV